MVDPAGDGLNFLGDGPIQVIAKGKVVFHIAETHHFLRQGPAACAAFAPDFAEGYVHPQGPAPLFHQGQLLVAVRGEAVDGHHRRQAIDPGNVLHMPQQIGQPRLQGGQVLLTQLRLGAAAMVL